MPWAYSRSDAFDPWCRGRRPGRGPHQRALGPEGFCDTAAVAVASFWRGWLPAQHIGRRLGPA